MICVQQVLTLFLDVSASGNVGSGGAATAAESAQMMPTDYSFIGDAANHEIGRAHV